MARLKEQYVNEIAPALNSKFGYKSVMQIPKLDKVVINVACGIKEQIIFPEIDFEKVDAVRGMDVCFVTTAKTDEEGKELLKALGAPFAENN